MMESVNWQYKGFMVKEDWVECGDVYNTILTETGSGDWAELSAKEVIVGLGNGTVVPGLEAPKAGWFVDDCTCGPNGAEASNPKCCTCECGYSTFKTALMKKLRASTHLKAASVAKAVRDWESHFEQWDNIEDFLAANEPEWRFPPAADRSAEAKQSANEAADLEENEKAVTDAMQVHTMPHHTMQHHTTPHHAAPCNPTPRCL